MDPAKDICDPKIKIVDMGNACWTYKKFTNDIQTREYRSFEVLMGADYQASVDIWSVGCIIFELATGDYLFNPRHGDDFATDEDHVAQMIERLGMPGRRVANKGKYYHKFFNRRGGFKCFEQKELDPQSITEVLMEDYKWRENEARCFARFIEDCLTYDPAIRPSASTLLNHPFFQAELREDYIVESTTPATKNEAGDTEGSEKATDQNTSKSTGTASKVQNCDENHGTKFLKVSNSTGDCLEGNATSPSTLRKSTSSRNYESFFSPKTIENTDSSTTI